MDEGQKELLRRLQEMLLGTERKLVAKFDQIETAITTCLTTGETSSSSTTSVRIDVHNDTPSPDTTCCVAVESAPACSNNEQATTSPTTRALTAMPLLEATSEIAAGPDTLLITPSSASIVDENLGVDPSGSATSITKAPSSCSTDCSSQQPTWCWFRPRHRPRPSTASTPTASLLQSASQARYIGPCPGLVSGMFMRMEMRHDPCHGRRSRRLMAVSLQAMLS